MRELAIVYLALCVITGCTSIKYAPLQAPYETDDVICLDLKKGDRLFVAAPISERGDSLMFDVVGTPPMGLATAQSIISDSTDNGVRAAGRKAVIAKREIETIRTCKNGPNYVGTVLLTAALAATGFLVLVWMQCEASNEFPCN